MEKCTVEKDKISIKKSISDLTLPLRQRVYKDIMELMPEADSKIKEGIKNPGVKLEDWPATYIFGEDEIIVMLSVLNLDTKKIDEILTFRIPREDLEKLNE